MRPKQVIAALCLVMFGFYQPAAACTPTRVCDDPGVWELWCCGSECNLYTYEVGKANGKLLKKNVTPGMMGC